MPVIPRLIERPDLLRQSRTATVSGETYHPAPDAGGRTFVHASAGLEARLRRFGAAGAALIRELERHGLLIGMKFLHEDHSSKSLNFFYFLYTNGSGLCTDTRLIPALRRASTGQSCRAATSTRRATSASQKLVFHSSGDLCGDWVPDAQLIENYFQL